MNSIVVCGKKFDIGSRVILWDEPNGFNGYDTSKNAFKSKGKIVEVSGKRYSKRKLVTNVSFEQLKKTVTQFFLHHDGLYRARDTFNVLHNQRRLSVHFLLDDDGTIYQTLDLKEKAWHGGKNNAKSVGIEIASRADSRRFPDAYDEAHQKKYNVGPRKIRQDKVQGLIFHGYEYNDKQYSALTCLAIVLLQIFPNMGNDFPRTSSGKIIKSIIKKPLKHSGFICHYNTSKSKWDPTSFDHDRFLHGVWDQNPDQLSTFVRIEGWLSIQEALKSLGYDVGPIDGIPGTKTLKALREFQTDNGLRADGLFGEKTQFAMEFVMELAIKDLM